MCIYYTEYEPISQWLYLLSLFSYSPRAICKNTVKKTRAAPSFSRDSPSKSIASFLSVPVCLSGDNIKRSPKSCELMAVMTAQTLDSRSPRKPTVTGDSQIFSTNCVFWTEHKTLVSILPFYANFLA